MKCQRTNIYKASFLGQKEKALWAKKKVLALIKSFNLCENKKMRHYERSIKVDQNCGLIIMTNFEMSSMFSNSLGTVEIKHPNQVKVV